MLESITRDTVIRLAKDMGIEVEERSIDRTELYSCDEALLCGSAMELTPILSIDKYLVNNGLQGEMARKIHKKYLQVVTGREVKFMNWLTPIY